MLAKVRRPIVTERRTADPPPRTLMPVTTMARESEVCRLPGAVLASHSIAPDPDATPLPKVLLVRDVAQPGHPGGVLRIYLPGRPPADGLRMPMVARERDRPAPAGSAQAFNTRYPDLPGPLAHRLVRPPTIARELERTPLPLVMRTLGYAPPEEPTPRTPMIAGVPALLPPGGSARTSSSRTGGGMLAPVPQARLVFSTPPRELRDGRVWAAWKVKDPTPPPNTPAPAILAGTDWSQAWRQPLPVLRSRAAVVLGNLPPVPQAFMVAGSDWRRWLEVQALENQSITVIDVQWPKIIVAREAWQPVALFLPVQASVPMRFGLLVAPTVPDPLFDAEPSAVLFDRFGVNGWPVFQAKR